MKARTEGEAAANPLGGLSPFFRRASHSFLDLVFTFACVSVGLAHLCYYFGRDRTYQTTLVPAIEVVKEQKFFVFHTDGTNYIFVHNVRDEILRQTLGVNYFLSGLFYVFHYVAHRLSESGRLFYPFKVVSPELFLEIHILNGCLPLMFAEAVSIIFKHKSRHSAVRNV